MAHTYALGLARASSTGNPITVSHTVPKGVTVVCLMLKVNGGTNRAGGSPTWGEYTFQQANTTQKAATSPEASTELWYLLNPAPGTFTLTIPNTGALTVFYVVGHGLAKAGGKSAFDGANGGNATSTNPTPGAIVTTEDGDILFATVCSGATTWNPGSQAGTVIQNTDDGAHGGGTQYLLQAAKGSVTLGWTFGTSDDWGAVAAAFSEIPPVALNNYLSAHVGDGMGCSEVLR